ncbi:MAG TPA: alpha/beta fold hydrolase [Nitrospiraceae bacterium]|nr:alpha/beta fold hydrolase [Nitrospiraceae bacterium]
MSDLQAVHLAGSDGKLIRCDRIEGMGRQILFITGFLSKRWGNKSQALAKWCWERGWGFCCYDVRGFGDSEGTFSDYSLSDWIADARAVVSLLQDGPRLTIVGNSIGGWIAWLIAQDCSIVERLVLIAPAFNMMGERAKEISVERRDRWKTTGWMPWDDDPLHKDWPLAWQWVEESERYWAESFLKLQRVKTTILHGLQDRVIQPAGSWRFVGEVLRRDPKFPIELLLKTGDHRLSSPEHVDTLRHLVTGE